MAVTAKFYKGFFDALANKEIDLNSDSIKLMITSSSYTPDQDAHNYKDDVTNEVTGTNYTAGGKVITGLTFGYNTGTNVWSFDGADAQWLTVTFTNGRYGVLYDDTPATAATKPLIGYVDFDANFSPSAGTFTVTWNSSGIGTVTLA